MKKNITKNNTEEKITIIVPAYNAETTISRCIESVQKQTYQNHELILIDDGSTDNTADLCYNYANNDPKIIFTKQTNAGPAVARNHGLRIASGEWITFLDADDTMTEDCLKTAFQAAKAHDADIVLWNMVELHGNSTSKSASFQGDIRFFNKQNITDIKKIILTCKSEVDGGIQNICGPVCKLFKKELIKNIKFPENISLGEDTCFVLQVLEECTKLVYINKDFYIRYIQEASLANSFNVNRVQRQIDFLQWMLDFFNTERNNYTDELNQYCFATYKLIMIIFLTAPKGTMQYKERKKAIRLFCHMAEALHGYNINYKTVRKDSWTLFMKHKLYFPLYLYNIFHLHEVISKTLRKADWIYQIYVRIRYRNNPQLLLKAQNSRKKRGA